MRAAGRPPSDTRPPRAVAPGRTLTAGLHQPNTNPTNWSRFTLRHIAVLCTYRGEVHAGGGLPRESRAERASATHGPRAASRGRAATPACSNKSTQEGRGVAARRDAPPHQGGAFLRPNTFANALSSDFCKFHRLLQCPRTFAMSADFCKGPQTFASPHTFATVHGLLQEAGKCQLLSQGAVSAV